MMLTVDILLWVLWLTILYLVLLWHFPRWR